MAHAVLRIYTDPPDAMLEHYDEIPPVLRSVEGFRVWGLVRTDTGCLTLTVCETAEACTETVTLAANLLAQTLGDRKPAPPTVFEGEVIFNITAERPEAQPHVVVAIFNQPPPPGLKEREAEIREVVSAAPGFRSWTAVGPTSTGGIIILVADDKAAADAIMRHMRDYNQANHPELAATAQPQLIEGQAIRRIRGETVPA